MIAKSVFRLHDLSSSQRLGIAADQLEFGLGFVFDETWFLLEAGPLCCNAVQMEAAIDSAKVGEYDGNEVAVDGSDGNLYMYGPDADRLFAVVRPVLEACGFMKGASVTLRYGPPADGVREVTVQLASWHLAGADA